MSGSDANLSGFNHYIAHTWPLKWLSGNSFLHGPFGKERFAYDLRDMPSRLIRSALNPINPKPKTVNKEKPEKGWKCPKSFLAASGQGFRV